MGCDFNGLKPSITSSLFQSTHPSWGATFRESLVCVLYILFQSTHPSWGATIWSAFISVKVSISIHAPIVGCDCDTTKDGTVAISISIHAPIVGCDSCIAIVICYHDNFNPRTHRGVRPQKSSVLKIPFVFQSTHPSWGATSASFCAVFKFFNFNPRTHRGVRRSSFRLSFSSFYFNPRTHRGVRLHPPTRQKTHNKISIHAPIVGCDFYSHSPRLHLRISIHAPIVGCDA